MASNRRKPTPNLSKPSEGESFNAERKPISKQTNPLRSSLNLTGERELGTVGGIKSTARLTVGVDNLIGQQGIDIEFDATNRTVGFGTGIGSTKGKLGVNIGGKIGYDEEGKVTIKGAEAGINIGGFGGSASIDEDEGIRGSISVAGAKVEIGISKDGKKNVSLCYGVPGGELCVTFEPDLPLPPTPTPTPTPAPTPTPSPTNSLPPKQPDVKWQPPEGIDIKSVEGCTLLIKYTVEVTRVNPYAGPCYVFLAGFPPESIGKSYYYSSNNGFTASVQTLETVTCEQTIWNYQGIWNMQKTSQYTKYSYERHWKIVKGSTQAYLNQVLTYIYFYDIPHSYTYWETDGELVRVGGGFPIVEWRRVSEPSISVFNCLVEKPPNIYTPSPPPNQNTPPPNGNLRLPNYPQHIKRMNCCDKVERMYKILGIAKFERNGFPVSNAFLVPGGTGTTRCFDFYEYFQALIRMLANGLILNPKSKPLGSEWQNVNATAWASGMYEMLAESMSDGNSTQRFEVAAIMQLTQMMATLAENGRKIEFVADAIGIEPLLVPENVPVCFTIYEGHKGFGKKEPKKINVSGLKTDDDVEKVLGKMLNPSLIPITAWKFKPGQISINEALRNG